MSGSASSTGTGSLELTSDDIDHWIIAEGSCPDPASDDGFGTPTPIGETTDSIEPNLSNYAVARWVGTTTKYIAPGQYPIGGGLFNDVEAEIVTTSVTSAWKTFSNYVTIAGGYTCGASGMGPSAAITDTDSMNINWPQHGPIPWRANVQATDKQSAGGYRTIGGIAVDGQGLGSGCAGGEGPILWPGGATKGSKWSIEGKWQLSNFIEGTSSVDEANSLEWEGRYDSGDGFHFEIET